MSFLINAIASILVFSIVIFIHELGHFVVAKLSGIKVNEFSLGMGPKLYSRQKSEKDTAYSIRALPIGGFVSMEGEDDESEDENSFTASPVQNRIAVVVAGAVMNIVLGFAVLTFLVTTQDAITSKTVSHFSDNAMTQKTGLAVGDEIVAVNGRKCYVADDIIYEFARTKDGTADFTVKRDGKMVELPNVTFDTSLDDKQQKQLVIDFTVLPVEKTFVTVIKESAAWTVSLARLVFLSLVDLVTGNVPINQMAGPVGIVTVISEAASIGIKPVLMILALITINLGVFNILPFPALDGGKLVFLLIEMVRGKPINQKYEIWVNTAGMMV
ncbi:MAG: M50 family metallopeptidase, partial [Oscillospiraceae bacterium]